jgi:chloride channel protein, CIC family
MKPESSRQSTVSGRRDLDARTARVVTASLFTGVLIGVVGGFFELSLVAADRLRNAAVMWAHGWPSVGWLVPLGIGVIGAALARLLVVRFAPEAEGSGVQRVEAVFSGEVKPATHLILPVKFFGGIIAIGSGLALGREGPTVQMGSTLARLLSRFLITDDADARVVDAAGAGAGLGVAFNAPVGGCIFVFEELTSKFSPWLIVATVAASTSAVWIMRLMMGNHFDFAVKQVSPIAVWKSWPFLCLGMLLGMMGALYNWLITRLLRLADAFSRLNTVYRAALIGATIGLTAWFAPTLVGGGDNLTQAILSGHYAIEGLAIMFVLRFFIGPWSYVAGAPGGLFAPMLVLGACFGALFGQVMNHTDPHLGVTTLACAVVGMGTLFSACVRAPLTGIVLTVEMTGRGDLTIDLLTASLVAIVVTWLLNSEPIYEILKRRMLQQTRSAERASSTYPAIA